MGDGDTWICPSCGSKLDATARQCPGCRATQIHRRDAPLTETAKRKAVQEDQQVALPLYIKEARYSIVIPGGGAAMWTSGSTFVTAVGFYFLSDRDGLHTELQAQELAKDPSPTPKRLANLSVYVPRDNVVRLVHGQFVGSFLEMKDIKIPLRFSNDDWKRFIAACRKLGVAVDR